MGLSSVLEELKRSELSFKNELNSEKFYKTLNTLSGFSGYIKDCTLLDELSFGKKIKNTCAKVLKYLETTHKEIYNKNDPYDVCLLLSYWLYNRLFYILQNESNVYLAYAKLQLIWTDFLRKKSYNDLCEPIGDMVNHNDWRKRKELYEYFVDYSPMKQIVDQYEHRCNEFYVYVENKADLYEYFESRCPNNDTNICPKFYKDCIKYNPETVLSTFKCQQDIINKREADARSALQRGDTPSGSETESRVRSVGMDSDDAPKFSGNPKTVENVGNILLGVVATTMTSGALYRFTPLGGMIRNGLGWNTNNMRNFNGDDIRLYDYASGPFNPYPGEEHYIGYHPA